MKKISKIWWIIFIAAVVRVISLNQSLWLDEGIQWWAVTTFSPFQLAFEYLKGDFNPPLYHLILHYWVKLFGTSEIALRLPSVIFGVATVYFVYKITQLLKLKGKFSIPEAAATLAALGPLLVYYSQEARMYSLATLAVTATFYFSLRYKKDHRLQLAIGYVLFAVAMLYSHYLTWLLIPVLLFALPSLTMVAILAIVPWLPMFWQQLQQGTATANVNPIWGEIVGGLTFKNLMLVPVKFLIGRISIDNNLIYVFVMVAPLVLLGKSLLRSIKSLKLKGLSKVSNSPIAVLWLWLVVPLVLGAIVALRVPVFAYFRFVFVVPALYILLTHGISLVKQPHQRRLITFFILFNLFTSFSYLLLPRFHRENWKGAAEYVQSADGQTPVVIQSPVRPPLDYYNQGKLTVVTENDLSPLINLPQAWYIPYAQPIFDPEDKTRQTLGELGFQKVEERHFREVTVERYRNFTARLFSQR